MSEGTAALTEKEKQALRLVVRGYDAKSMAWHLGLLVHTVKERLRFARRKMQVSSSREAARLLFAREGGDPKLSVSEHLADASRVPCMTENDRPHDGPEARIYLAWIIGGLVIMSLIAAALLLSSPMALAPQDEEAGRERWMYPPNPPLARRRANGWRW